MKFGSQQIDIVIIGANPTGLLLAAQLLKFGIQPIIIDSKSFYTKTNPTLSLNSISLEILDQLGLLEDLTKAGIEYDQLEVKFENENIGSASFTDGNQVKFPFRLGISQNKLEESLINYLALRACPIQWDVKVSDFKQSSAGIKIEIQKEQKLYYWDVKWLAIAEKKQFDIENLLSVSYTNWAFSSSLYQLVIQTDERHNHNQHLFLYKKNFIRLLPVNREGEYEFIGSFNNQDDGSGDVNAIKGVLHELLGFSVPVESYKSVNTTSIQSTIASEYINQHCILLGDSTFYQSVILGDSINMGMQDAFNIAWKLANTIRGKQAVSILSTYEEERRNIAQKMHKDAYWIYYVFKVYSYLPKAAQRSLIKRLLKDRRLSSSFDYRKSSLSLSHTLSTRIQSGDRLPFLRVYDEKKLEYTDLHQWCRKPGFTLLLLGNLSSHSLFIMSQWMKQKYTQHMHLFYLPYSERNAGVFEAFEVNSDRNKMVLVRPDLHIGYMHDFVSANLIDTYMIEVMKWRF